MPKTVAIHCGYHRAGFARYPPVLASADIDKETLAPTVVATPLSIDRNAESGECNPGLVCVWAEKTALARK